MIFGIASYHRPECKTIKTLLAMGIPKNDIVVSLQDKNDIERYKANYPDIRFLFREADSAAGNRNTILDSVKERPICLLDDDIVSFCFRFVEKRTFLVDNQKFLQEIYKIADEAIRNKCVLAGISPTDNNLVAEKRDEYTADCLLQGSVLLFFDDDLRFDSRFKMVEDYELSLRVIYGGGHILRGNHVCANKPKNGTNKGGLHDRYERGELPFWLNVLHKKYPLFVVNKNKTGGEIKWKQ